MPCPEPPAEAVEYDAALGTKVQNPGMLDQPAQMGRRVLVQTVGERRLILERGLHIRGGYDVTPDGNRILVAASDRTSWRKTEINVVLNWLEVLKERVPTGR